MNHFFVHMATTVQVAEIHFLLDLPDLPLSALSLSQHLSLLGVSLCGTAVWTSCLPFHGTLP